MCRMCRCAADMNSRSVVVFHRLLLMDITANFVLGNPLMLNSTVCVTGYFGGQNWLEMVVGNTNASLIEAFHECIAHGYSISSASHAGEKFTHLRNHLYQYHPEFISVPLWTGLIKPNLDGVWYVGDQCHQTVKNHIKRTYINITAGERQCLLMNMSVNTEPMAYTWYATSCFERHPFICQNYLGARSTESFDGMKIQNIDNATSLSIQSNTTLGHCKGNLKSSDNAFFAEYNYTSSDCTLYTRSVLDLPKNVNLTEDSSVISIVKTDENIITVLQMSNIVYDDAYYITDVPCYDYGISTQTTITVTESSGFGFDTVTETISIPLTSTTAVPVTLTTSNLDSSSSLNQWIVEAKEENIINEKSLSSYRNKRVSAYDGRPSSRAMGVIGSLCITVIISLIILSDIPNIVRDYRRTVHLGILIK